MVMNRDGIVAGFDSHHGYLTTLAEQSVGPRLQGKVDPLDLVQQTLLRACQSADQFRGSGDREVRAWLRSILSNIIIDSLRRFGGADGGDRECSLEDTLGGTSTWQENLLKDDASTPSQRANRNEIIAGITKALNRLPEDQRIAVGLRHLHGATLAETAARMGKTTPAVAGLLRRGLETLRTELNHLSPN